MASLQKSKATDTDLLSRFAREKDEVAFATLMRRHWGFVFSVARNSLSDSSLAEDATQQTFIALSKRAEKLSHDVPLGPWLYRAVRHEASNLRRREQRLQKRNREYATLEHSGSASDHGLSTRLQTSLASLSEMDRELILLRFYQGLTADQIASRLGISPAAAQRRTHRALERLSTITQSSNSDHQEFGIALPALLSPQFSPSEGTLTKVLSSSTTGTSLFIPVAGWILATTLSVSAVKQIAPETTPPPEPAASTRTVSSDRVIRDSTVSQPLPEDPDLANFITLARTSPDSAFSWSRDHFPDLNKEERFLETAARYLAENNLPLAKELLASRQARLYREPWVKAIFHAGMATDLPAAVRWVESLPNPSDQLDCSHLVIQKRERRQFIDQFIEALPLATNDKIRLLLAEQVADHYEETDETKLLPLAQTLDEGSKKTVLNRLANIYLDRDHPMANELIHELEGEVYIDHTKVALRNPARFLEASLPYLKNRFSPIHNEAHYVIKYWFELDPDGVRAWATQNDPENLLKLPAHQRTR